MSGTPPNVGRSTPPPPLLCAMKNSFGAEGKLSTPGNTGRGWLNPPTNHPDGGGGESTPTAHWAWGGGVPVQLCDNSPLGPPYRTLPLPSGRMNGTKAGGAARKRTATPCPGLTSSSIRRMRASSSSTIDRWARRRVMAAGPCWLGGGSANIKPGRNGMCQHPGAQIQSIEAKDSPPDVRACVCVRARVDVYVHACGCVGMCMRGVGV